MAKKKKLDIKKPATKNEKIKIISSFDRETRISFNFSYILNNKKYNHEKLEHSVHKKLLEKMHTLSCEDFVIVKSWKKEQGFEKFQIKNLKVPDSFSKSYRGESAGKEFWVFRLSKLGRVICKRIDTVFYIIAIDTHFDLYKH